jgi:hypothetical protein
MASWFTFRAFSADDWPEFLPIATLLLNDDRSLENALKDVNGSSSESGTGGLAAENFH